MTDIIMETTSLVKEGGPGEKNEGLMYLDPSWFDIIKIPDKKRDNSFPLRAWVSFKPSKGMSGDHGELISPGEGQIPEVSSSPPSNKFTLLSHSECHLELSHEETSVFRFVGPVNVFSSIHGSNVLNMDVSRGGIGVSLGKEGKKSVFRIWETENGIIRRELNGHHGYGYSVRLFPSGIVVLTSGADMVLQIWSAETGTSHRSLKGHQAAVNDSAVVGLGKNVISISNDSTIRLWNCGTGSCLKVLAKVSDVPIRCDIADYKFPIPSDKKLLEGESGTEDKLLIVGCENGLVVGLDVGSSVIAFEIQLDSGVKDVQFYGGNAGVFVGCENGYLYKYSLQMSEDKKHPSLSLQHIWEDSESSIESLLVVHDGVFAGRRDGSCIWYPENASRDSEDKRISLLGADADPIYCMACDGEAVYTGARDGRIRKYRLAHIFKSA